MKKIVLCLLMLLVGTTAMYAKKVEVQPRVVKSFSKVRNETAIDIRFIQKNSYKVEVTAIEVDQNRVVCETTPDGTLVIRLAERVKGFSGLPTIEITAPRLDRYEGTAAGSFSIEGDVEFFDFKAELSGAGNLHIDTIRCKHLSLITEAGGNIKVKKAVVRGNKEYVSRGRGKIVVNGKKQPIEKKE